MNNLFNVFNSGSASWVRYGEYAFRYGKDGKLYIKAEQESKPSIYNPLAEAEAMVTDAVDVGRLCMNNAGEKQLQEAVMGFVRISSCEGRVRNVAVIAGDIPAVRTVLPRNIGIGHDMTIHAGGRRIAQIGRCPGNVDQ